MMTREKPRPPGRPSGMAPPDRTILFVIDVVQGGPLTAHGMIGVALCGLFGAFLFWEIRKPKG